MKKNAFQSVISLILCLMLLSGCAGALAQEQKVAFVSQVMTGENGAKMRSQPTTYGDNVIFNLGAYVELDVVSYDEGWYRVRYNGRRGYVAEGVVFITGYGERDTGKEVPQEYFADQQMWASVIDLRGDSFLFDGNFNKTFSARHVSLMDGEYWRYGGHELETTGVVINKGANLRSTMEAYNAQNVVYQNLPRRTRVDVKCYFFDKTGGVWYYIEVAGMEGYIHSDNLEVDGFEPPVADEEDDF